MKPGIIQSLRLLYLIIVIFVLSATVVDAQKKTKGSEPKNDSLKSATFSGLKWRSIGPAFTSGRIADFAVNPKDKKEYYVAVASGHVWRTTNAGSTFEPVFDNFGAYSIGVVTMDPNNHNVIWVGTGENNHQRALGYGNGVWKSLDGGKSFTNMGLKESRQTGGIVIDPRNSDNVFVAAEGSVWGPGGDRGLYKTTDGGTSWKKVISISEHTGVNNVVIDPCRPEIMYATSEQRRRHVFSKIGGGPESAVYKSTDGGETWRKLTSGLPEGDKGGMGIAVSPSNPDIVYLIIEATEGEGGFFRSADRGESWSKMSSYNSSGQYYNEICCDPVNPDVVYSLETVSQVTRDGGKTWAPVGNNKRHVDDHAMWIDPDDPRHFLIGGDGGIYESWDGGLNYDFKSNLPVTQFYRVSVDNEYPFYNVYGGTQDNNTLGGPSRNTSSDGVTNEEWKDILGGDGFWVAIDPDNPDIIYCEYQYGNMYRYDRKSGEKIIIKPEPGKGEDSYKWNWDTPLILSPHSSTRLYAAANKVFRSDDRGDSWKVISKDITAGIDRNTWMVMDHYWSYDAVAKDVSTSLFGTAVSLAESTVKENLLFVGTDDGVISVSEDPAGNWRQVKSFPGIPVNTYVSDIFPDRFDENVVYASFNNHQRDDFKPYLLKSTDKGQNWVSISGNLPENGPVLSILQDVVNKDLLFAGTEFGVFFSIDGGKEWVPLKAGLPSVAVKDMVIQERENDLVIATFGRGFYILDDMTPLRLFNKSVLDEEAHIFPVRDAKMYIQTEGKYGQGTSLFNSNNPEFGATITYYLKEVPKTLREKRMEAEKTLFQDKKPIPQPTTEELRAEQSEEPPYLLFTIYDQDGNAIRKIIAKPAEGINRITWDLRYDNPFQTSEKVEKFDPFAERKGLILAMPGTYSVDMKISINGVMRKINDSIGLKAEVLNITTLPAASREELVSFQKQVSHLILNMTAAEKTASHLLTNVRQMKQTLLYIPNAPEELMASTREAELNLIDLLFEFNGREARASSEELPPGPVPLNERLNSIVYTHWTSTSGVTQTQRNNFQILSEEYPVLKNLVEKLNETVRNIQSELDKIGAPWTPGRTGINDAQDN
jgi:photosystem II stability/assembly factor-like uncharacterized protein